MIDVKRWVGRGIPPDQAQSGINRHSTSFWNPRFSKLSPSNLTKLPRGPESEAEGILLSRVQVVKRTK